MSNCSGSGSSKGGGGSVKSAGDNKASMNVAASLNSNEKAINDDIQSGSIDHIIDNSLMLDSTYDYSSLLTKQQNDEYINTDFGNSPHIGDRQYNFVQKEFDAQVARKLNLRDDGEGYATMRSAFAYNVELSTAFRNGTTDKLSAYQKRSLKRLDKLFNASRLDKDYITFRGVNATPETLKSLGISNFKQLVGKILNDKGYACQTTSLAVAARYTNPIDKHNNFVSNAGNNKIIFINTIKKGQKAIFADESFRSGGYGTNQQLTTDRNSSFLVKHVSEHKGITYVYTETIQEN